MTDPTAPRLTHPDRVYWPGPGLTKQDYADYLETAADRLLAHVARRPLGLVRLPEGLGGPRFFQRHPGEGLPDALRAAALRQKSGGTRDHLYLEDRAGLAALAQIGALEIHPWGARIDDVEAPERLVMDLDPGEGASFDQVREAAREMRRRLEDAGLSAFALLTGGKGVHVVAPLDRSQDWAAVKAFARDLARAAEADSPDRYTARAETDRRRGKVFIDWLRNARGAMAIAPYSARARPGAPAATPIRWDELAGVAGGGAYTIASLPRRLAQLKSDPWAGYADKAGKVRA